MQRDARRGRAGGVSPEEPGVAPASRQAAVAGAVAALALVLLAFFGVVGAVIDEPFRVFTKEVAEQAGFSSYVGVLAHLTWFLWVVAATAGVLAATVLWRRGAHDRRIPFLLGLSALTGLLLVDDFAMLHDQWLPLIGVPEESLYLLYAVVLVVLLVLFRRQFREAGIVLPVAAGALWMMSLATDVVAEHMGLLLHAVEDGAKFVGTALWAAYMVWCHLAVVGGAADSGPRTPGAGAVVEEECRP